MHSPASAAPWPPKQIPLAADWQRVLELAGAVTHARFKAVAFVQHATTNTQVRVRPLAVAS